MKTRLRLPVTVFICLLALGCPKAAPSHEEASAGSPVRLGSPPEPERDQSAPELNKLGFALYTQKDYAKAAEYFGAAVEKDPAYAVARYNLACTLSLLFGEKKFSDVNAIVGHLHRAWRLDEAYRAKMKKDADLDPIRSAPEYRQWVARLDQPEFKLLARRFASSFFQYHRSFLYENDSAVLRDVELDNGRAFIPLSSLQTVALAGGTRALVCDLYFSGAAAYENLMKKGPADWDETSPFGELREEGMTKSVFVLFYDAKNGAPIAEYRHPGWRVSIGLGKIGGLKALKGMDAFQAENDEFASGSYTQLRVYALSGGRVLVSEPITTGGEDLSGGQSGRPDYTFGAARREGGKIVIDRYEDKRLEKTITLLELAE